MREVDRVQSQTHLVNPQWATLVDVLRWRALHQPERRAYVFLSDGEQEERTFTYSQLDAQARAIAATLQQRTRPGERALLLYPPGLEYIAAFLGCLYAGVIAVPLYPPTSQRSLPRVQLVTADAGASLVLASSSVLTRLHAWSRKIPELSELMWIATDEASALAPSEQWRHYTPVPEDLMFLQYTSGSTGSPRGVMVSHGNIMHNVEMMRKHFQTTTESVGVSWLPMFHDMGLIAGILQPLFVGFPVVFMAPAAFIQRPLRWLQALSRYQGTTSYAPNFAYELCISHTTAEERAQLHLEHWHMTANGAEPVRPETVQRFTEVFAPCGMKSTTMTPAYGLAETTLMVSCSATDADATIIHLDRSQLEQMQVRLLAPGDECGKSVALVSCGYVADDQHVAIVHPETLEECPPQTIGEVWVAGPSVTQGYWQHPLETAQTFRFSLPGYGDASFVRTGDLGFLYRGELFLTGRLKDLIIIRGRNYYPQDIELTVERSHPALRPGCGAAFSVDIQGEERLVVLHEVARHQEEYVPIIQAIRQAIAEQYEIKTYAVVLLRHGSILKTSSGKIQRRACRDAFLKRELLVCALDLLEETPPIKEHVDPERQQALVRDLMEAGPELRRTLLLSLVTEEVCAIFQLPADQQILPTDNLFALGMDSLLGTRLLSRLISRLENLLGHTFPDILLQILSEATIQNLVEHLATLLPPPPSPVPQVEQTLTDWLVEIDTLSEDEVAARLMEQLSFSENETAPRPAGKTMQFSLLYFSSNEAEYTENKYRLLLEGAKFADQNGFAAIWLPERHFHPFGGLYPNPSVLASALAMVTRRIRLRAGSVVLPLHHPVRVAEEWSVVDNLSSGRVDLAFAIGWNPNDFVLAPTMYEQRKEVLFSGIQTFQQLWRGEAITLPNGRGATAPIRIYPRPQQTELTPWITSSGSPERFSEAGALGANLLTALLFQSQGDLAEKIQAYRDARASHGFDPATGHVTLMLHTFVGQDIEEVRRKVQSPLKEYLRSSMDLQHSIDKQASLSNEAQEQILSYAFERYFENDGLFGTPQTCQKMVEQLGEIGVDEIACLIDFGVDIDSVLDSLSSLALLQNYCQTHSLVK